MDLLSLERLKVQGALFVVALGVAGVTFAQGGPGPMQKARAEAIAKAAAKPTPRLPDGHPDLNGYWRSPVAPPADTKEGGTIYLFGKDHGSPDHYEAAPPDKNPPSYKPEFVTKVKDLNDHESKVDPAFTCTPLGVPRVGPPHQIVQTSKLVVLLYQIDYGGGDASVFRTVPIDRPHRTDIDPLYFGDSVGHWEGDTLVVDVTRISTDTWMGQRGYFHSKDLHVIERITRKGDTIQYQATVEDPGVLTKPWVMDPYTEMISDDNVVEVPPCMDFDQAHLVNDDHHGAEDHPR